VTSLLLLAQWLHIGAAMVFAGGHIAISMSLWPALLQLPAPQAREFLVRFGPSVSRVMGGSAMLAALLGLLRGTVFGQVTSLVALGTPYGLTFLASIVLMVALMIWGAKRGAPDAPIFEGDAWHPGVRTYIRTTAVVSELLVAGLLACMVAMRFGM
jgi:uncharacterized membrane protein